MQGDIWYSSLNSGLMVSYAQEAWRVVKDSSLRKGDFVRIMQKSKDYFVTGSQLGVLLVKDTALHTIQRYLLPAGAGAVEKMGLLYNNTFLGNVVKNGAFLFKV